jgi:release factor glutamine methyltransferase
MRAIIAGAVTHLCPGGWLLLEHGLDQAQAVVDLMACHGFEEIQTLADLAGLDRVSLGGLAAGPA